MSPELSKLLPFKARISQNIALHVLFTARCPACLTISALPAFFFLFLHASKYQGIAKRRVTRTEDFYTSVDQLYRSDVTVTNDWPLDIKNQSISLAWALYFKDQSISLAPWWSATWQHYKSPGRGQSRDAVCFRCGRSFRTNGSLKWSCTGHIFSRISPMLWRKW